MEKIVIIGGGISGLSCMNALLDRGYAPLLLEGSVIGTPKMCGEFLAPIAVKLLKEWNVQGIQNIEKANFYSSKQQLALSFPLSAGAISRSQVEMELAKRARNLAGRIRENSCIERITIKKNPTLPHVIHLVSGEEIRADHLMMATGKFSQQRPLEFPYKGIKIHFPHILQKETLLMWSVHNGYFGIVPISEGLSNLTCIARKQEVEQMGSGKAYLNKLLMQHNLSSLQKYIDLENVEWLEAKAPEFGVRQYPDWPSTFWIGDAAASLHPAIGSGFAHGIESAVMAAQYYQHSTPDAYQKQSRQLIRWKLPIGRALHELLLRPPLGNLGIALCHRFSWLAKMLMTKLDYA